MQGAGCLDPLARLTQTGRSQARAGPATSNCLPPLAKEALGGAGVVTPRHAYRRPATARPGQVLLPSTGIRPLPRRPCKGGRVVVTPWPGGRRAARAGSGRV